MRRVALLAMVIALTLSAAVHRTLLPSGWHVTPDARAVTIGTMPQGITLSPDGSMLAVVESGYDPPALRILSVPALKTLADVPLKDAFGKPRWRNDTMIDVPGGSSGNVWEVNRATSRVVALPEHESYVDAVALDGSRVVAIDDRSGPHPADAVALRDGSMIIADKGASMIERRGAHPATIPVDLHPAALALSPDGSKLYVACADADAVDIVDLRTDRVVRRVAVGLPQGAGASPNAIAVAPDGTAFVSLGAENAVAKIRNGALVARAPAGWYPAGVAVDARNVYVADGKGEGSHANPSFTARTFRRQYVAALLTGSVRAIPRAAFDASSTAAVVANIPEPVPTPEQTVVRANGPIKHIIYIIKENRTYDQVLGDIAGANGDPKLTMFGEAITPNQHAFARRFGTFDNTYANAQVSADGHNWSTAAFANDYLERYWPVYYGRRRTLYDFEDGAVASTPRNGYLWDDADAHHVSLRDYGEFTSYAVIGGGFVTTSMPGLKGKIDERYAPFDLQVSDETRVDEWQREFNGYVRNGDLPQLEIVRLPNDHTSGTAPGMLTPQAYVAQNDHAFGRIVDAVSHSKYWHDTAIFAIEDDAQNGADHVSDQRTTFYVASPYAARGVHHAHYSTASVLRTIEVLLGLPPMSIYDAVAPPLYDAFTMQPDLTPFETLMPRTDMRARNARTAYGSALSARMNWNHADDVDPRVLNDILAHVTGIVKH